MGSLWAGSCLANAGVGPLQRQGLEPSTTALTLESLNTAFLQWVRKSVQALAILDQNSSPSLKRNLYFTILNFYTIYITKERICCGFTAIGDANHVL